MNMNANNLNFCGRYVLQGSRERINLVATNIKKVKGNDVEFLPMIRKNANFAIVATDEDAITLRNKKKNPQITSDVSQIAKRNYFLSNIFKYLFGTDKNALIVDGDHLAKFSLISYMNDYNDGSIKGRKTIEKFVDGTYKKYTGANSRLTEYSTSRGDIVSIEANGTKTIKKRNGEVEVIPAQKATKISSKSISNQEYSPQIIIGEVIIPTVASEIKTHQTFAPMVTKNATKKIEEPIKKIEEPIQEIIEEPIKKSKLPSGVELPFRDGIMQVLDEDGNIQKLIFSDGTEKIFAPDGSITEKILPDGTRELFNDRGRMYMTVSPDGTRKYTSRIIEIEG